MTKRQAKKIYRTYGYRAQRASTVRGAQSRLPAPPEPHDHRSAWARRMNRKISRRLLVRIQALLSPKPGTPGPVRPASM